MRRLPREHERRRCRRLTQAWSNQGRASGVFAAGGDVRELSRRAAWQPVRQPAGWRRLPELSRPARVVAGESVRSRCERRLRARHRARARGVREVSRRKHVRHAQHTGEQRHANLARSCPHLRDMPQKRSKGPVRRRLFAAWLVGLVLVLLPRTTWAQAGTAKPHGEYTAPCAQCHLPDSWRPTKISPEFKHAPWRFVLEGAHARASCANCQKRLDFTGV